MKRLLEITDTISVESIDIDSLYLDMMVEDHHEVELNKYTVGLEHAVDQVVLLEELNNLQIDNYDNELVSLTLETISTQLGTTITMEGIGDTLKNAYNAIKNFILRILKAIKDSFMWVINKIKGLFSSVTSNTNTEENAKVVEEEIEIVEDDKAEEVKKKTEENVNNIIEGVSREIKEEVDNKDTDKKEEVVLSDSKDLVYVGPSVIINRLERARKRKVKTPSVIHLPHVVDELTVKVLKNYYDFISKFKDNFNPVLTLDNFKNEIPDLIEKELNKIRIDYSDVKIDMIVLKYALYLLTGHNGLIPDNFNYVNSTRDSINKMILRTIRTIDTILDRLNKENVYKSIVKDINNGVLNLLKSLFENLIKLLENSDGIIGISNIKVNGKIKSPKDIENITITYKIKKVSSNIGLTYVNHLTVNDNIDLTRLIVEKESNVKIRDILMDIGKFNVGEIYNFTKESAEYNKDIHTEALNIDKKLSKLYKKADSLFKNKNNNLDKDDVIVIQNLIKFLQLLVKININLNTTVMYNSIKTINKLNVIAEKRKKQKKTVKK